MDHMDSITKDSNDSEHPDLCNCCLFIRVFDSLQDKLPKIYFRTFSTDSLQLFLYSLSKDSWKPVIRATHQQNGEIYVFESVEQLWSCFSQSSLNPPKEKGPVLAPVMIANVESDVVFEWKTYKISLSLLRSSWEIYQSRKPVEPPQVKFVEEENEPIEETDEVFLQKLKSKYGDQFTMVMKQLHEIKCLIPLIVKFPDMVNHLAVINPYQLDRLIWMTSLPPHALDILPQLTQLYHVKE